MKKTNAHNYRIIKETIVLSEEEQMKQAYFNAYVNNICNELKRAHDKDELIDTLKYITKSVETYYKGL
jgi:hypothetical protein